jgi:hypothetical protein
MNSATELEFLNNLWGLGTEWEYQAGGIDSLKSILGLLKSLNIRALGTDESDLFQQWLERTGNWSGKAKLFRISKLESFEGILFVLS